MIFKATDIPFKAHRCWSRLRGRTARVARDRRKVGWTGRPARTRPGARKNAVSACRRDASTLACVEKTGREWLAATATRPFSRSGRSTLTRGECPMSVPFRRAGLLLALPLLLTASGRELAEVTRFDDLLRLVRAEPDPVTVLEKCGATVFTLNADQRAQLTKAGATASLIDALQKKRMSLDDVQNFALVVDCSGSMKEKLPDGRTKMDAAKAVLTELVQKIPDGLNVSLTLYGHDVAAGCQAVEVKRSLSQINSAERQALTEILAGLEPVGYTPIAAALRAAGGTLEGAKGLSQVVLVTDGMETCHEDPAAVAEAVTLKHQLRRVQVVGLGIKVEEKSAVMRIACMGRGKFYDTQTAQQLAPALKKVVRVVLKPADDKPDEEKPEEPADLPPRVKALVGRLQDRTGRSGSEAADSLGKMGAKAKGAVPALVKRVADERYGTPDLIWAYNERHNGVDKNCRAGCPEGARPEKVEQASWSTPPRPRTRMSNAGPATGSASWTGLREAKAGLTAWVRRGGWGLVFETPYARTLRNWPGKRGGKTLSLDVLWLATPSRNQELPDEQHTSGGDDPANRLGARPRADRPAHRTDPTPPKVLRRDPAQDARLHPAQVPQPQDQELRLLAAQLGLIITERALKKRFTPRLVTFLRGARALMQHMVAATPVDTPLLAKFTSVRIGDSTTVTLPADWPANSPAVAASRAPAQRR